MMEEETSENRTTLKSTSIRIGRVNIDHVYRNGMTLDFNHSLDLYGTMFGIAMLFSQHLIEISRAHYLMFRTIVWCK